MILSYGCRRPTAYIKRLHMCSTINLKICYSSACDDNKTTLKNFRVCARVSTHLTLLIDNGNNLYTLLRTVFSQQTQWAVEITNEAIFQFITWVTNRQAVSFLWCRFNASRDNVDMYQQPTEACTCCYYRTIHALRIHTWGRRRNDYQVIKVEPAAGRHLSGGGAAWGAMKS